MIKNFYFILLISFFIGCKNEERGVPEGYFKVITATFSLDKEVLSTDIIDSIEFIQLEDTDELIGNVKKMVIEDNKIMLWDSSLKCIWVFDDKGKFINRISKLGKGPQEYASLSGFSYAAPDRVQVNDTETQKIKTYSIKGDFLGEEKTDGYVYSYLEINEFAFTFNYLFSGNESGKYYFNVKYPDDSAAGFFPYNNPFLFFNGENILKSSERIYLTLPYYDTIYSFENSNLSPKFVFDFGENRYPTKELYDAKTIDGIIDILSQDSYEGNISQVLISSKYVVLNFHRQIDGNTAQVSTLIYNIETESLITYNGFDQGQHEIAVGYPTATDGDYFYSLKNFYEVPDGVKRQLKGNFSKDDIDSNPLIIKYKYRL